jgi:thiosulfate/3-mercaptopyruvate sulfurtransferase
LPFTDNLADDGTFLPAARLAERHASGGNVIHMCGSGVTACHNILATLVAGHAMPKLYAGSWSEWITDSGRAVAKDD